MDVLKNKWNWYETKYEIAGFILNRLENYKSNYNEKGNSLPNWVLDGSKIKKTYSEEDIIELKNKWNQELDIIIDAFKQILNYTTRFDEELHYDEKKIQEGLNKFSKYFLHLWD